MSYIFLDQLLFETMETGSQKVSVIIKVSLKPSSAKRGSESIRGPVQNRDPFLPALPIFIYW